MSSAARCIDHSHSGSLAFVSTERGAGGQPTQIERESESLVLTDCPRGLGHSALHFTTLVLVCAAVSAACLALAWLGATGAVPWGYNEIDHGPVWQQFAALSAGAITALVLTVAMMAPMASRRVLSMRYARRLGAMLCVLVLAWGLALLLFGLWGDASLRPVSLAAASIAPALALAAGVTAAGALRQKWSSVVVAGAVIAAGAVSTAWTFTS